MHYNVIIILRSAIANTRSAGLLISILWFILFVPEGHTQSGETISFRHVKGIQGIELAGGISDLGTAGSVYYSKYFSQKWYGKIGFIYEIKNDPRFKTKTLTADITGARTVIFKRNFFLSGLAGGSVVINETLDGIDSDNSLNTTGVGIMGGAEIEYYLSNRFVIVIDGIVRYIFNSDIGKERFYGTAGLKFTF